MFVNGKVMIIEDEVKIADAIAYALKREGFSVEAVHNGTDALDKISAFSPEVVILDVMLPGLDGYEILKKLKNEKPFGVIMLTAKEDIVDKVLGLELGADDYMTKPFDMRELMARVKSLLRRIQSIGTSPEQDNVRLGGIQLQLSKRSASAGNQFLDLTPKEYDLLALLVSNPDRVYSREQLLDLVWGMEYIGGTRTVDIHIQRLRKKLGQDYSETIQTLHGIGYKAIGGSSENKY